MAKMTLGEARRVFSKGVARLLTFMISQGYQPMIGRDGLVHMKNSLHYEGLAIDIDLTKDGKYLKNTEDHKIFGDYWKSLNPNFCWGGDFQDGNHYSIMWGGRK